MVLLLLCAVAGNLACTKKKTAFLTKTIEPSTATCVLVYLKHINRRYFFSLFFSSFFSFFCCMVWVSSTNKHKLCKAMLKFFWLQKRKRKLWCSPETPYFCCAVFLFTTVQKKKPGRICPLSIHILLKAFTLKFLLSSFFFLREANFCLFNWACWSHARAQAWAQCVDNFYFSLFALHCVQCLQLRSSCTSCAGPSTCLTPSPCPILSTLLKLILWRTLECVVTSILAKNAGLSAAVWNLYLSWGQWTTMLLCAEWW